MGNTLLGMAIMLVSTTCMNIGTVIQKKAVDKLPPMESQTVGDNVKGVVLNKIWIVGWLLTTLAMVLNMVALGYADMTVIQPLIGFGLVVLVASSHFILGEKPSKQEIGGIAVAIIGVVILGVTAEPSREFITEEQVLANYLQINAAIILIIFLCIILSLWFYTKKAAYKGAGVIFALIAATFSVTGLTFSKGVFSIVNIRGFGGTLGFWPAWVLLICFMTCSTMAIACQQMSLQKGKSVVVTPVFNLTSIVLPLSTGYMVFSESIGVWKLVATLIILAGAFLLSLKKVDQPPANDTTPTQ
jgi:drug/metabolite transporter (DMT)-like permease